MLYIPIGQKNDFNRQAGRGVQTPQRGEGMKKTVKDGWHVVYDDVVYVEDGIVKRAISNWRVAYPYRKSKYGGWDIDTHMSLDALRAGISRGTIVIS